MERLIIAIIYSAFEQVLLPEYAELYKCLHYEWRAYYICISYILP